MFAILAYHDLNEEVSNQSTDVLLCDFNVIDDDFAVKILEGNVRSKCSEQKQKMNLLPHPAFKVLWSIDIMACQKSRCMPDIDNAATGKLAIQHNKKPA